MAALPAVACASLTRTPLAAHLQRVRSAVQLVWERRGRRKGKDPKGEDDGLVALNLQLNDIRVKAKKIGRFGQRKLAREARKGEADRHVFDLKPKHLFSGKRSSGKTDRR
uniref:Uncharacterized protein n=1 Tax=Globodera rostochiensis TaxID=31243 RepID=A0A914H588_GLORO